MSSATVPQMVLLVTLLGNLEVPTLSTRGNFTEEVCVCSGLVSFRSVWVQKQAEEFREKPGRHCAVWLQPPTKEHLVASV